MKRIICLVLTAVMVVSMAGCKNIKDYSKELNAQVSTEGNYPVTVENVEITKSPEKVVSLTPAITQMLCDYKLEKRIVGISKYCTKTDKMKNVGILGSPANPDIDGIISLKPDIVLTQSPIAFSDVTKLEDKGIKVVYKECPATVAQLIDYYAMTAKIFMGNGHSDIATKEQVEELDNQLAEAEKKKFSFKFVYIMNDNMNVASGKTLAGDILKVYGKNIAENCNDVTMSADAVVTANPDIIFIAGDVNKDKLPDKIKQLAAFKQSNVITIDNKYFERPTANISELVKELTDEVGTKTQVVG